MSRTPRAARGGGVIPARPTDGGRAPPARGPGRHERIYALVSSIPAGRVATYGQIAALDGRCTPREVGWALAALPAGRDVPWHRVINARGAVSPRRDGDDGEQRARLEAEGVRFDRRARVELAAVRWSGPGRDWLETLGFDPLARAEAEAVEASGRAPGPAARARRAGRLDP